MSGPLHMLELRPEPTALVRFLDGLGLNNKRDEDFGYGVHAWLAAAFGKRAPKPFRLFLDLRQHRPTRLLAYSPHSKETLAEQLRACAEPAAWAVCPPESILAKPLPLSWEAGRRFAFEVLVCPVSRKDGVEKDVFLRQAERTETAGNLTRAAVYRQWLARQVGPAAELETVRLDAFRLIRYYRKGISDSPGRGWRPQAVLSGTLRIRDGGAFSHLLARGVGRHRAFGYGMVLLRRSA